MRLIIFIISLHVSFFLFAQKRSSQIEPEQKRTVAIDTIQYSLGVITAKWMSENGFSISNPKYFLLGMDDGIKGGGKLLNDSIISQSISKYKISSLKEKGLHQEQQLFASLIEKKGVGILPNGIRYIIKNKEAVNMQQNKILFI